MFLSFFISTDLYVSEVSVMSIFTVLFRYVEDLLVALDCFQFSFLILLSSHHTLNTNDKF